MSETFTYWGEELEYLDHPYNTTRLNERCVEVPIAESFLQRVAAGNHDGLELGNVLSHYWIPPILHRIVDRYEGPEKTDVFNIKDSFAWIVAISTIEHVRWDEEPKTADGATLALEHLLSLSAPGGRMLVTVPFGWHPFLDTDIIDGRFTPERECTMVRDKSGGWEQVDGAYHQRYAKTTIWAESVWVAEFQA